LIVWGAKLYLSLEYVYNMSRQNPRQPKTTEKCTPNSRSHITIEKKVIHRLLIHLAYATFVHHHDVLSLKLTQGEDLA
jgi:hypothetical protein